MMEMKQICQINKKPWCMCNLIPTTQINLDFKKWYKSVEIIGSFAWLSLVRYIDLGIRYIWLFSLAVWHTSDGSLKQNTTSGDFWIKLNG